MFFWWYTSLSSFKGQKEERELKRVERLLPERPFPSYAFLPGHNPHPNKRGGHSYGVAEVEPPPLQSELPFESSEFLFSLDLYNFGFYWESHVGFEALWNKAGRKGFISDFLKALIKLGACGVKARLKLKKAAEGHLDRAYELFQNIEKEHAWVAGFFLRDMLEYTDNLREEISHLVESEEKTEETEKNTVLFPPLFPKKDER